MKSLVIAEKPSVGRDIARVLGCKKTETVFWKGTIILLPGHWAILWNWRIRKAMGISGRNGRWKPFPCFLKRWKSK